MATCSDEPSCASSPVGVFGCCKADCAHGGSSRVALLVSLTFVIVWALCTERFDYSDTSPFVVNKAATILALLIVFSIQPKANRDEEAIQIKLEKCGTSLRPARAKT